MRIRCAYLHYMIVVNLDHVTDTVTIQQVTAGGPVASWTSTWSDETGIAPVAGMVLGQDEKDCLYVLDYLSQRLHRKM